MLDALPMPLMGYANDRLNNALMIPRVPPGDHLQRVDASRLKSVAESLATVRRKSVYVFLMSCVSLNGIL